MVCKKFKLKCTKNRRLLALLSSSGLPCFSYLDCRTEVYSQEFAKLRGLRGYLGSMGQKYGLLAWVAWVYKILTWVKKMA